MPAQTHGHCVGNKLSPTYVAWSAMMQRCYKPTYSEYSRYGAKGIAVHEDWHGFANFLNDMGERPSKAHTLDRIDNARGYEPGNCRWATMAEQNRNQRRNRRVMFRGEMTCLADVATAVGLAQGTLGSRLDNGWDLERAISTPVNTAYRRLKDGAK